MVSGWVENPYWQYFCGEVYFQHEAPIDPSSLTRFRTYLGRVVRDIERKIAGNAARQAVFADELALARRLLAQQQQDKNKLYSLHAPEVECISKGKVAKRYDKSSGQTICTAQAARRVAPREGRNHLKGTQGDQLNVLLSCAGHNLRLILRRLRLFCLENRTLILAWLRLLAPVARLSGVGTQLNRKLACLAPLPAPIMAT